MKLEDIPYTQYFQEERKERIATKMLYRLLFVIVLLFLIIFSVNVAFDQKYMYITISGQSMQNMFNPDPVYTTITTDGKAVKSWVQDGVYVEKTKDVTYDDVIIIENVSNEKTIIKRLLALGGDYFTIALLEVEPGVFQYRCIRIKENSSVVEVLEEDYVKSHYDWANEDKPRQDAQTPSVKYEQKFYDTLSAGGYQTRTVYVAQADCEIKFFQIPENEIFYLGDNRTNSSDSRKYGTTKKDNVLGKVVEIVRNGTYYEGNDFYFLNRLAGYFKLIWEEILRFFGANI